MTTDITTDVTTDPRVTDSPKHPAEAPRGRVVREAIGVFFDTAKVRDAIADLQQSGFGDHEIGILASENIVERELSDLFDRSEPGTPGAPNLAFVNRVSGDDTTHAFSGGLLFVGSTAAAGAVVASAAVLGGALAIVAGAVASAGAIGAVMSKIIQQSDAEYLEQQINEGHILLFVRTMDATRETLAKDVLAQHDGFDVRIYETTATS